MTCIERKREMWRMAQRKRRARPEAQAVDRAGNARLRAQEGCLAKRNAEQKAERRDPETWAQVVLRNVRHRAKRKGLECTLTPADIEIPAVCPVLGIPLVVGHSRDRWCGEVSSPSLDRVDSAKGYTPGNVRVISYRANALKSNATRAEIRALLEYMEREGAP